MRVNETLQGYADALDRGDIEALLQHFDADAEWHYSPTALRRGHDEIRAFFAERLSVWARTSHNVCAPVLRPSAAPGEIESTAYFTAEHLLADGSRYRGCGRYVDGMRLMQGRAIITRRQVIAHLTEGTDRVYNFLSRKPFQPR